MSTSPQRLLGVSLLVSAAVLTVAELEEAEELPEVRQYLGLGLAFFMLSAISDLGAEEIAGGIAMLVMVTVLLTRGEEALAFAQVKLTGARRRKRDPLRPGESRRLRRLGRAPGKFATPRGSIPGLDYDVGPQAVLDALRARG